MNGREVWQAVYGGERPDRMPVQPVGPWAETLDRWHEEGLPEGEDHNVLLGLAGDDCLNLPLNLNMVPEFPVRVLSVDDEHVTLVDEYGVTKMMMKSDYVRSKGRMNGGGLMSGMSHWIDFPVKGLADWKYIFEGHFRPTLEGRLPADWNERKTSFIEQSRTRWVCLFASYFGGFFSALRQLMGLEGMVFAIADDPQLVRTIIADLAGFYVSVFSKALADGVRLDQLTCFEDMCSTKGPLMSPAMFRQLIAPGYRELTGALREMGVSHVFIDTDGNAWELIPDMIAAGVTGTHPCEAQATMDVEKLRNSFPRFCLDGGIDKRALTKGPAEIDAEVERAFRVAWQHGRYTPALDHCAPPDIPWANIEHYAKRCLELAAAPI